MPEFAYGGTVTFDPNFTLEKKNKLLREFENRICQHLSYKSDYYYRLAMAKEYHKVDGEDDYEAPHIHFILFTSKILPKYRRSAITEMLKYVYGRSQFYLMTSLKTESYYKYIQKDVEKNNEATGYSHFCEKNIEEPIEYKDYFEESADEYFDEEL